MGASSSQLSALCCSLLICCRCHLLAASIAAEISRITEQCLDIDVDADDAGVDDGATDNISHTRSPDSRRRSYMSMSMSISTHAKESIDRLTSRTRILGRFMGLLTFWPQWALSLGRPVLEGPLRSQVRYGFAGRLKHVYDDI